MIGKGGLGGRNREGNRLGRGGNLFASTAHAIAFLQGGRWEGINGKEEGNRLGRGGGLFAGTGSAQALQGDVCGRGGKLFAGTARAIAFLQGGGKGVQGGVCHGLKQR